MTLAQLQSEFFDHVLDDERPLPFNWDDRMARGLDVYRNAYRARLVGALRETYPRTAKWVGEEAFDAAAAHFLISSPPTGWTLDDVGDGFVETLGMLFTDDPEVPELAWLEWAMHKTFVVADHDVLDASGFGMATQDFDENDWMRMNLKFSPSLVSRQVQHDIVTLWKSLDDNVHCEPCTRLNEPSICVVWRDGHQPVFRILDALEGRAVSLIMSGSTYGELCEAIADDMDAEDAARAAGALLARLLIDGMIARVECRGK